ncbi:MULTISPECIES: alpha/beta hydrolase family protein [Sphingomonas]|jgi:dipeptidyl aminopeptidase/acylaminoacyl peptidase|nr:MULTISPECIES: S9 family peptidase [Sphingomonas]MBB4046671.1 dipeptidyl aminopeptidase/acylaminoacyl peptidase [Sphingomonas zeae]MDK8184448.1 S9 family peptidase [Sphingomonas zeae]MDK8214463.1 S9 family peptidase [Sphingomonas sp. UMB7805-LC452B]
MGGARMLGASLAALGLMTLTGMTQEAAKTPPTPAPAAAKVGPQPVEAFAALPEFERPALSPDGTRIAGKRALNGKQYLMVAPLLKDHGKPALAALSDKVDVNWWRWVNDEWLIVGLGSQDTIQGEDYYVTRLIGIRADMQKMVKIDWDNSGFRADEVLWTAQDGTPRILFAKQTGIYSMADVYPSVFEADVSTGRVKRIANGQTDVWDWYADGQGQLRMGVRYSDETRKQSILYRQSNAESFRTIARADGRKAESVLIPSVFRADGTALAIDDSDGYDALYEVSLPDLKLGRKLSTVTGYDIDGIIRNPAGNDISAIRYTDQSYHDAWTDPHIKEIQEALDKSVAPRRAEIVSWNTARTRFLVTVGSPSSAGALYYWDTDYGNMQFLSWTNPQLKGQRLSPVRTVRYPARDGTVIEAVLTLPRGHGTKNLPLIVMPHGGPFARDAESWDWWSQYLAELGYVVIQPNYRGSSGYGTAFAKKGEGEWGLKMQDDLDDAVAWAAKEGIADPKRACMVGASYGGYAAMRAAQRNSALYRCAVSYAGVSDLAAMKRYDSQFLFGKTRSDWLKKQAPDYRAVSPRFGAADMAIPLLIVHGKADKRVPVNQSRMMVAALKAAGKSVNYIEQPLADHHFTRAEDRLEFLKAMAAFLAQHNPA